MNLLREKIKLLKLIKPAMKYMIIVLIKIKLVIGMTILIMMKKKNIRYLKISLIMLIIKKVIKKIKKLIISLKEVIP